MRVFIFLTDIVGNFIGEYIFSDVFLNISVFGVGNFILLLNVNN